MSLFIQMLIFIFTVLFCIELKKSDLPCGFRYEYYAKTTMSRLNHKYIFHIVKTNGNYRCYVLKRPSCRKRSTYSNQIHLIYDTKRHLHYICWTGRINNTEQAKTLCRMWADRIQQYIDTGIPAPGFGG